MMRHIILVAAAIALVKAQDDRATCMLDSSHQWGYNTIGQSPCEVAGDLLSACLDRDVYIVSLDAGSIYSGAQTTGVGNDCRCSSVYYAVLASCAQCQGRNWGTWEDQIENCANGTYPRTLPIAVPVGTRIPPWAYLDYPSIGTFDLGVARAAAAGSSISPSLSSTTVSSTTTPSGSSVHPSPTPSNDDDDPFPLPQPEKKTNVGAIVGGVVGGLVALGLIGGLIAFILLRNKKNKQQQSGAPVYAEKPSAAASPYVPQAQVGPVMTGASTGLYNPNDPSTYPTPMNQTQYTGQNPSPFGSPQIQPQPNATGYQQGPFSTPPMNPSYTHADASSPYSQQLNGGGYAQGPPRAGGYAGAPEV